jgi:PAS domain S-box-containing protein
MGLVEHLDALEGEDYFRLVVEHAPDGILITAPDGRLLAANPAACALLGRTEEEVLAAGRAGVVVEDAAFESLLAERERRGAAHGILTLRRRDGSTFLADTASTVFLTKRNEAWTSLRFRDVTETERARRALEILAEAGRSLGRSLDLDETLRSLTDLVVPRIADVCTVDLEEADGIRRAAVAHRDPSRVPDFEDVRRRTINPTATNGVDYVLRTGRPSCVFELTDEWLRIATVGRTHFEQARALGITSFVSVPLLLQSRVIGALTIMSDGRVPSFGGSDVSLAAAIAAVAASAIDNAHRHADAIEARRLRDEVLSIVAHDLRGPLNAIQLTTEVLRRTSGGAHARELETIRRAIRRADMLIEDLLVAAKAEGGAIPIERHDEDARSLLEEVAVLHRPLAREKKLHFEVVIESEPGRVSCDRHRIVQMLSNLVGNAIKFTAEGGSVTLRSQSEAARFVVSVTDTGAGIPRQELPFVFDRFWQGARAHRVGAGLGLAISQGIARAHGGIITVESEVQRGTTFTVVLPRRQELEEVA